MTSGNWKFTRSEVKLGGTYIGRRGGRRFLESISIDQDGREDVEYIVLEGRREGQRRHMTMRKFIEWCKKKI